MIFLSAAFRVLFSTLYETVEMCVPFLKLNRKKILSSFTIYYCVTHRNQQCLWNADTEIQREHIIWQRFCQKPRENERIWTERDGACS